MSECNPLRPICIDLIPPSNPHLCTIDKRKVSLVLKIAKTRRLSNPSQEKLKQNPEVRPFPAALSQLLGGSADSTASTIEAIIEFDAGLSIQLLRLAGQPAIRSWLGHFARRPSKALVVDIAEHDSFSSGTLAALLRC